MWLKTVNLVSRMAFLSILISKILNMNRWKSEEFKLKEKQRLSIAHG